VSRRVRDGSTVEIPDCFGSFAIEFSGYSGYLNFRFVTITKVLLLPNKPPPFSSSKIPCRQSNRDERRTL
jgi:hypothetical protein